jgi:hypothetical protein
MLATYQRRRRPPAKHAIDEQGYGSRSATGREAVRGGEGGRLAAPLPRRHALAPRGLLETAKRCVVEPKQYSITALWLTRRGKLIRLLHERRPGRPADRTDRRTRLTRGSPGRPSHRQEPRASRTVARTRRPWHAVAGRGVTSKLATPAGLSGAGGGPNPRAKGLPYRDRKVERLVSYCRAPASDGTPEDETGRGRVRLHFTAAGKTAA